MHHQDILVRKFTPEDITTVVDYFHGLSYEFLESLGIDKSKFFTRDQFIDHFNQIFRAKGNVFSFVIIELNGRCIGHHNVSDIRANEDGIFHSQIWYPELRGRGIGVISYIKACDYFMKHLELKKIVFKTPKINQAAKRLKEKLGLPILCETTYDSPLFFKPLVCYQYEVDSDTLVSLKTRFLR